MSYNPTPAAVTAEIAAAVAPYLTQANAAATYLTQANAAATYLTQADASTTYLALAGGTMTGQLVAAVGSAAAPSVAFAGDTDTGIFRSAANVLGFGIGGAALGTMSATKFSWNAGTQDTVAQLGLADIGTTLPTGDNAGFAFNGLLTDASYAIRQIDSGTTQVNAKLGRTLSFGIGGTPTWQITGPSGSHFIPSTDATYNIGADANRIVNLYMSGQLLAGAGTAAAPGQSFQADPDTGAYSVAANAYGISTGGTGRWQVNSSGHFLAIADNTYDVGATLATRPRNAYVAGFVATGAGSVGAPSHTFDGDQNTGLYNVGADRLGFTTAGAGRWEVAAAGHFLAITDNTYDVGATLATRPRNVYAAGFVAAGAGSVGAPSITFDSDQDTGLYSVAANALGFSTGGTGRWQVNASGHILAILDNAYDIGATTATRPRNAYVAGFVAAGAGSVGAPSITFDSDQDTGLYSVAANALGFSTGGTGRWQVNASGHILAILDNTYDIGAAGATRPRNLFVAGTGSFGSTLNVTNVVMNGGQFTLGAFVGYSFTGSNSSSGTTTAFTIAAGSPTNQTLSTEIPGFKFSAHTRQWATGAIAAEREFYIDAPTYSFVGASTITYAATLGVIGAPIAGTNATITDSAAAWFGAKIRIDSAVALGGGAAPTLGTIGGTGPTTAAQEEWIAIDTQNGRRFVAAWK